MGMDLHAWTYSIEKAIVFNVVFYAGLFLFVPLVLTKGMKTMRQPAFLLPVLVTIIGIALTPIAQPMAALVVVTLAFLHWRFDLSGLGIQSHGLKGDAVAILLIGLLQFVPVVIQPNLPSFSLERGLLAGLGRLFANPASTVENLFYFGFIAERLSRKTGKWITPPLIGAMYMVHEMSNPEYWYEGMSFGFVFVGVTLLAAAYLWRRSVPVIWLGDGLGKFVSQLF
jgi:hypothetical protein